MTKSKIQELEVLRSIAFFAVVIQHILGMYLRGSSASLFNNIIIGITFGFVKFAVPVFIFLTGVVLFYHYYAHLNYFSFIKKRFISIVLPYIAWSVLYVFEGSKNFSFWKVSWMNMFVENLFLGSASYHLWYIIMILQAFLLLPLIFTVFKYIQVRFNSKKGFILSFTIFSVVYLILIQMYTLGKYIPIIGNLLIKYRSKLFIFYIFYFVLGGICALYYKKWLVFIKRYFIFNAVGYIIFYLIIEYVLFTKGFKTNRIDLNMMGSINLRFFFFTTFNIFVLYFLALLISNKSLYIDNIFSFIGKHSFQAYLAHALMISMTKRYMSYFINISNKLCYYIIVFIISSIFSILTAYLLNQVFYCVKNKLVFKI